MEETTTIKQQTAQEMTITTMHSSLVVPYMATVGKFYADVGLLEVASRGVLTSKNSYHSNTSWKEVPLPRAQVASSAPLKQAP